MKITILGSGTCIPNKTRGSSGYYIETVENKILLDCGNGTTWKLEQIGASYTEISHIFISHLHPDHTSDLIPLLFANKYPYNRERNRSLEIWGPVGFFDFYQSLKKAYGDWISPEMLTINEIDADKIRFGNFNILNKQGFHSVESLIYRIESNGKSVVYSGDTDYCRQLIDISINADLLIIECSSTDDKKIEGHLSPKGIIEIANKANPKKIVLTHLYPICDEIDIVGLIKPHIKPEVIKAEDLLEIKL
jgi:ribonuclease BN (tRNA processing enzyme)